ncbi:site-specific DNA-methyltransferase [Mycoplasma sp. Pen4]|nr:DNA methyltransferase [Mycoplasma sp. Pen4]QNM93558.1 site-specific DNA-methyltransferase [Mycoplasma sp. Pen4]
MPTTENGTNELKSIMTINSFDYPKPKELIQYLLMLTQNQNARILDFFAGSGTTGHAVEELNREDGGKRTYTLVTNNENHIADKITYERLFRINHGFGTNKETIKWTDKNEPYNSNLDVFQIRYDDISPFITDQEEQLNKIMQDIKQMLKDFGLKNIPTDKQILYRLNPLKIRK